MFEHDTIKYNKIHFKAVMIAWLYLMRGPTLAENPIITDQYTADPAAIVYQDTVYLYTGHDQAPEDLHFYDIREWLVFSSTDMVNWTEHDVPLKVKDFKWAVKHAWAAHVIEKDKVCKCPYFPPPLIHYNAPLYLAEVNHLAY